MKYQKNSEFVYQLVTLILAIVIVHLTYSLVIRPQANTIANAEFATVEQKSAAQRSIFVVLKDYEQELCFILAFWATAIIGFKMYRLRSERGVLQSTLVDVTEGTRILPEDARQYTRPIQNLGKDSQWLLLPKTLLAALHRFISSKDIQDVASVVNQSCETEGERLDTELSMIRYLIWAIPSIGFIGTVRGIGQALGEAHRAVEGDIAGVTASLGVAFNSTLVALVISLFIMFLTHQLQLMQERLVIDVQDYCNENLIRHLQVQDKG